MRSGRRLSAFGLVSPFPIPIGREPLGGAEIAFGGAVLIAQVHRYV
jgi:hypothetical protein